MTTNGINTGVDNFGERLEHFLEIANIPKIKLAEMFKVTKGSVTSYVQSRSELSFANLYLLHQKGCNLTWLITGKGTMFAENECGNLLERQTVRVEVQNTPEYNNDSPASTDSEKSAWHYDFQKALKYGNEKQRKHLEKISNLLLGERYEEIEEADLDTLFVLVCKLVYEGNRTSPSAIEEVKETEKSVQIDVESPKWEYQRYALVREWLTVTGTIEEWWMKCREVQPDMTLNEVLALEGRAKMPKSADRDKFYNFLIDSGINLDWLIGVGEDVENPFLATANGEALKQAIFSRVQEQRRLAHAV